MAVDSFVEHVPREQTGMADAFRGIDTLVCICGIGANAAALLARGRGWSMCGCCAPAEKR